MDTRVLLLWLLYQIATTAGLMLWYARRHPDDARRMVMKWKSLLGGKRDA